MRKEHIMLVAVGIFMMTVGFRFSPQLLRFADFASSNQIEAMFSFQTSKSLIFAGTIGSNYSRMTSMSSLGDLAPSQPFLPPPSPPRPPPPKRIFWFMAVGENSPPSYFKHLQAAINSAGENSPNLLPHIIYSSN